MVNGFQNQPLFLAINDHFLSRKLELAWDPNRLIAAVSK